MQTKFVSPSDTAVKARIGLKQRECVGINLTPVSTTWTDYLPFLLGQINQSNELTTALMHVPEAETPVNLFTQIDRAGGYVTLPRALVTVDIRLDANHLYLYDGAAKENKAVLDIVESTDVLGHTVSIQPGENLEANQACSIAQLVVGTFANLFVYAINNDLSISTIIADIEDQIKAYKEAYHDDMANLPNIRIANLVAKDLAGRDENLRGFLVGCLTNYQRTVVKMDIEHDYFTAVLKFQVSQDETDEVAITEDHFEYLATLV